MTTTQARRGTPCRRDRTGRSSSRFSRAARFLPWRQATGRCWFAIVTESGWKPRILYPNGFKRVNRIAFVIHPLSREYFKVVKPIKLLSRVSPPLLMDTLEKAMA